MGPMSTPSPAIAGPSLRFTRRHLLMLVLALEILIVGSVHAERDRHPGVTVEVPANRAHVIT